MRFASFGVGFLLLYAVGADAQHAPRSPAADRYAQVRAVLSTDSVAAVLAGRPVIIDPTVRWATSTAGGRKLQTFPVAFALAADSVSTLTPAGAVARPVGIAEEARGDTILVTVARRGRGSSPEYVVQLRSGADGFGYEFRTIALHRRGGQWRGRQIMFGMP